MTKPILSQDAPVLMPLKRQDASKAASSFSAASNAGNGETPLTFLQKGKRLLTRANTAFLTLTLSILFFVERVLGSEAITHVETFSEKVNNLVGGPIGRASLLGATILGAWKVFQQGSIPGAAAIVIIGAGITWEIGDIMKAFDK